MHHLPLLRTSTPQLLKIDQKQKPKSDQDIGQDPEERFSPLTGRAQRLCLACIHVTQGVVRVSKAWPGLSTLLHTSTTCKRQPPTPLLDKATLSSSISVAICYGIEHRQTFHLPRQWTETARETGIEGLSSRHHRMRANIAVQLYSARTMHNRDSN